MQQKCCHSALIVMTLYNKIGIFVWVKSPIWQHILAFFGMAQQADQIVSHRKYKIVAKSSITI